MSPDERSEGSVFQIESLPDIGLSFTAHAPILMLRMKAKGSLIAFALLALSGCAAYDTSGEFSRGRQALMLGDNDAALGYFQSVANKDPRFVSRGGPLIESIWTYIGRVHYLNGRFPDAREALEKGLAQQNGDRLGRLYLGLTLARLPAAPAKTGGFSLQDVSFALREGVETERVAALARERGINFDLTREAENQLKKAGADARLLEEIKKVRAATAAKSEPQTARAAKELTAALTGLRDDMNYFSANSLQGRFWDPGAPIQTEIGNTITLLSGRERDWTKIVASSEWIGQKLEEEIDRARRDESNEFKRDRTR
jgi:tetratricopeptide (TPR) repeat protein